MQQLQGMIDRGNTNRTLLTRSLPGLHHSDDNVLRGFDNAALIPRKNLRSASRLVDTSKWFSSLSYDQPPILNVTPKMRARLSLWLPNTAWSNGVTLSQYIHHDQIHPRWYLIQR